MSRFSCYLLILLMFFLPGIPVFSQQDLPVFSADLFYMTESLPDFNLPSDSATGSKAAEKKQGEREVLKEAVYVFSGMIYGFEFSYTPGDLRRNVEEKFSINQISVINWGDPGLKIRKRGPVNSAGGAERNRVNISFLYYTEEKQRSWLQYWSSGSFPLIGGKGEGGFSEDFAGKAEAIEKGVKEALRSYLRGRVHNKPQKIEGEFVFAEAPVIIYSGGTYQSSVKIRVNIKKISPYSVY